MANPDTTTVIIEWRGPFNLEELKTVEEGNGLYLLTGKLIDKRAKTNDLLYCGITEKKFCKRVNYGHNAVKKINPNSLAIWIGCLKYPKECVRQHLEDAEGAFISFWDTKLNDKKKRYQPDYAVCIVSRWCKKNGVAYKRWPAELGFIKMLDDVLWWDLEEWRIGNLRKV